MFAQGDRGGECTRQPVAREGQAGPYGVAGGSLYHWSDKALGALRERFDTLSSREREIMFLVTAGRLNK